MNNLNIRRAVDSDFRLVLRFASLLILSINSVVSGSSNNSWGLLDDEGTDGWNAGTDDGEIHFDESPDQPTGLVTWNNAWVGEFTELRESHTAGNAGQGTDTKGKGSEETFAHSLGDLPDHWERHEPDEDVGDNVDWTADSLGVGEQLPVAGHVEVFVAYDSELVRRRRFSIRS